MRLQLFYSRAGMSSEDTIKALQQVQHASKQTNPKAVQLSQFNDPLSHQQTHPHLKLDRTIIEAAKTAAFHELEKVRDAAAATFRMHAHASLRLPHSTSFLTFPPLLFLLFIAASAISLRLRTCAPCTKSPLSRANYSLRARR